MKKKIFGIFAVILFVAISYVTFLGIKKITTPKKVHFHAGFVVFQNDRKLNFSDFKYMLEKPCVLDKDKEEENEDTQAEKAHLHDKVGDVVHIERSGATWKDLFTNIKFPLDYNSVVAYVNGKKVDSFESRGIQPDDTLVVFIGKNDVVKDLKLAPSKEYVAKMAKKSTTCGD